MPLNLFSLLFFVFTLYTVNCQCNNADDNYIGDLCYKIPNQMLTFQNAQSYCYGLSANLAVIHTSLQANFLASLVRTKNGLNDALFWIGLSRPSANSRFQWDDGTTMYWSNFDSSFPKDNNYVAESVVNGKWRTLGQEQLLYFVCSYDPRNVTPGTAQPTTIGIDTSTAAAGSTTDYTSISTEASFGSSSDTTADTTIYTTDSTFSASTSDYFTPSSTISSSTAGYTDSTSQQSSTESSSAASSTYSASSESSSTTSSGTF